VCLRNLAVVTGEPLAFCQITNPVIGFGPPTSAAIQDISGLHPSTSCVERAPNRDVVTLFVTTCEDHLGIRNDNLQVRAVQTTRTEAGAANLELPIRWPRPSGLISTVIVKGATFACFEYSGPDQMPRTSAAAWLEPLGGAVWASVVVVVAETNMILSKHTAIEIQKGTLLVVIANLRFNENLFNLLTASSDSPRQDA
jgi:hypothetical protein